MRPEVSRWLGAVVRRASAARRRIVDEIEDVVEFDDVPAWIVELAGRIDRRFVDADGRPRPLPRVPGSLVAAADRPTGAMIALVPSDDDLDRLALDDGEPRDELHLTLWYLGDAADWDDDQRRALIDHAEVAAGGLTLITGRAFGANLWNPVSDEPAWVLAVGDELDAGTDTLDTAHDALSPHRVSDPSASSGALTVPEQHTPWVPHICVAYSDDPTLLDALVERLGPVVFDRVRLAFAGDVHDVSLVGVSATLPASASHPVEATVPWHKVENHADCPADEPWAVVRDGDDEVEGCHATEAEADDQLAALYATEPDAEANVTELSTRQPNVVPLAQTDCPAGMIRHPTSGECVPEDEVSAESLTPPWTGVLVVEGVETGDGREFAANALTWAEPPLSLRWNKEDSHGGTPQTVAVNVGRIDRVWREGNEIRGSGVFNLQEDDGRRAYQLVKDQFLKGVSIDADDISDADIEYVWPDDGDTDLGEVDDIVSILFGMPERTIYHAGRIRAATLCDIPAFVEATIALDEEARDALAASAARRGGTVSDAPWDYALNERRLPLPTTLEGRRDAYAVTTVADDGVSRDLLLHHEVGDDGTIGAANVAACATALGLLQGARGGLALPDVDRRVAYEHLAEHLRDAGREPPPLDVDALVAHAAGEEWRPAREWFDDPALSVLVPITLTDQGRVYGHAAQWGQCHLGFTGECVTPPREDYHPYFMTGEVVCADGSRVAVGQITVGTGHAPLHLGATAASEHYDNTGSAVADVAIGNDRHGIWVAGALRPDADVARVQALRAAGQLSGDWRRIGGQLRLVGLLAVNVPGYPVPRLRARVASGEPQALVAAGQTTVSHGVSEAEYERRAMLALRDNIARRVHATSTAGR